MKIASGRAFFCNVSHGQQLTRGFLLHIMAVKSEKTLFIVGARSHMRTKNADGIYDIEIRCKECRIEPKKSAM